MGESAGRRLAAEALGTALLLAAVVGSGIMAERLSGGSIGLALLANALATGAMLVVLITVFAPLSGAHFNPAVTLVFLIRREITAGLALGYGLAQTAGAVLGVWLAHLMFDLPVIQISVHERGGTGQWLAEAIAAFVLVLAILGPARRRPETVPWTVGLTITAAYWFTASTSFANPAVTLARSLTDTFAGIAPSGVPAFALAQVGGALGGAWMWSWLAGPGQRKTVPPSAATDISQA
jgi:glycerol uptake facilitator-like aquaporin